MASQYVLYPRKGGLFHSLSATNKLILANVLFYIASLLILAIYGNDFFLRNVAITPDLIVQGKSLWTFFTSMFSHILFFHIFANMFTLFFIGNFLERIVGRKRLFGVYIVAGLVGGIFFVISGLLFSDIDSGIGASGAVFGLLGVLAVLVPYSRIYLIAGPLIVILLQVILSPLIPSSYTSIFNSLANVLIIVMIFSIFSFSPRFRRFAIPVELPMWVLPIIAIVPLVVIGYFFPLPIGNSAHIGGLLAGLSYGMYLRKRFPKKTLMIERHFR